MKASKYIAKFDSATGMLRATSRFLHGKDFPALGTGTPMKPLVPLGNLVPDRARQQLYIWGGWMETIHPRRLSRYRSEAAAEWVVGHYPKRRYPAAMIGSSNGAVVHLCCALGIPWLPQTLLIPVERTHVHPDDFRGSLESAKEPAKVLLEANPDLQLHHMHDPNQDRLMVRKLMYFRVKRRRLGEAYTRFLEENVAPGGTLFLLECGLHWPTVAVDERHFFQIGAYGGASAEEYLHGGPRVEEFLRREGSEWRRWDPPEPDGWRPEAEWGFEPALRDEIEQLARRRGFRVRRILFERPEQLSPLVADFHRWWYRRRNVPADRVLAESFIVLEPYWALRVGAVPFWGVFGVEPTARSLEDYLTGNEQYDELLIMLFSHGVESVGVAPIERWRSLFRHARRGGRFIGVDEQAFPKDFAAFVRYHDELKQLPSRYPIPGPLALQHLDEFLHEAGDRYPAKWE